ncbi:hypothetical protein P154DRAFT_572664 [Amniculicola lignicola CBS 123094]|uniref:SWR1-complex protein 3 domain-containing protein n=1 Tax=Amniculicola lignicola CBS 123094 TaxID=1392246 RepID=A0A6A5WQ55_9PLEO|nr:hypothetical protein P154DRAFT_572664 [Amniculicola lignicola CBS 123094]
MSEPRRSTRTRAREEAVAGPPPESPKDTPTKAPAKASAKSIPGALKRKRTTAAAAKDSAPATPTGESTQQQAPRYVLPVRLLEGQPLPTLPEPQPLDLPAEQYQSIQQSGILSASLQRSRAVWISGANFRLFHAFFAPPKKVADRTDEDKQNMQRQKEIVRNFPQLGGGADTAVARMVIEPHTFPIRLYGPREAMRAAPKKAPQYGQWPNHTHGQYPAQQQQQYQQQHHHQQQQQYSNPQATPYVKPPPPQQQPHVPKPPQQNRPPPPAPTTPAPDPVIHMLAQRAGADPELKAVMKIVAAGKATEDQLQFFQRHIAELTTMLQRQKEAAAKAPPPQPPPPPPAPKSQPPPPAPMQTVPPPQPVQVPQQHHQYPPKMHGPAPPIRNPQHQMAPTPAPHQPPYQNPNPYHHPYNQPPQYHGNYGTPAPAQPPRATYRPLVFDFVEGNGDKFYFPSYSFMEWLPNNQGAKFSFLITRMKPKPKVEPKENVPKTPTPKPPPAAAAAAPPAPVPATMPITPNPIVAPPGQTPNAPTSNAPLPSAPATPSVAVHPQPTQYVPPPRIEDFNEKKDTPDIELYQPVTVIILTQNYEILQSLPRAIRPPDVVEKYMNTVFDTSKRAEETYLAFRLPKEGAPDAESTAAKERRESHDVQAPTVDVVMTDAAVAEKKRSAGRSRRSLV